MTHCLSSLELITPPTKDEINKLRRQAYVAAHLHWMQTRGIDADMWGFTEGTGPNTKKWFEKHRAAARYAREMSDIAVLALLNEYPEAPPDCAQCGLEDALCECQEPDPELHECPRCSAKPGAPNLCARCLRARKAAGDRWQGPMR
jgi:hypothetical protein